VARSSFHQSAFLGGEWSPLAQGRSDIPAYRQAMNVCLNGIPIEEGAWTRRSGFQFIAPTRNRLVAKLLPFLSTVTSYLLELTDLQLRIYAGTSPAFTTNHSTVSASSLASQFLTLTVGSTTGWVVGDDMMLWAPSTLDYAAIGPFRNRVMQITVISGNDVTLGDETGAAFGAGVTSAANVLATCELYQIIRFTTPWTGATTLANLRCVQADDEGATNSIILSSTVGPYELRITPAAVVSLAALTLEDGPYLDPQGDVATVSGYSGSITLTATSTVFPAADVGRNIRLFSQPPAWSAVTTYSPGDRVTYGGAYWVSIADGDYVALNVGIIPGTMATSGAVQVTVWAPAPEAGSWAWGYITAASGTTACTVGISTNSLPLQSANGTTLTYWRLGVYTIGHFPTCGSYHDGRMCLAGAYPNRFDMSSSNDINNFSPTDAFGMVTDAHAISRIINSDDLNDILWMSSDPQGLLIGTASSEWLIQASTLNDPITPTSIQVNRVTKYGCAFVEPRRIGMVLVFIQRYGQRVIEYLADAFSGRFAGRHLNEFAKHVTSAGVTEIAYQEERAPILWARMEDGTLAGCTYRRVSRFVTEAPVFQAWHRHPMGGSYAGALVRQVSSIAVLPNDDGLSDLLFVATANLAGTGDGAVEVMRPIFEDA
jgi:hypothetical protein